MIRRLAKEKTIIFSTHIMQEAGAISDRILIINAGTKIADGTIAELEEQAMSADCYRLTVRAGRDDVKGGLSGLASATDIRFIGEENDFVTFEIRSSFGADLWSEVDEVVKARGWPLRSFGAHRMSLEDMFLELTRVAREEPAAAPSPAEGGEDQ